MSGYGFHWTPCRPSGGGGGLIAILVAVAVCYAIAAALADAVWFVAEYVWLIAGMLAVGLVGSACFVLAARKWARQESLRVGQQIEAFRAAREERPAARDAAVPQTVIIGGTHYHAISAPVQQDPYETLRVPRAEIIMED